MNFDTKYDFGDLLKDNVTGFEGIVMVKALYSTGCLHYGLSPQKTADKDGSIKDPQWIWWDESRLSLVQKEAVCFPITKPSSKPTSGPSQINQSEIQINNI